VQVNELPYVDEHSVVIAAGAHDVWAALIELDHAFSRAGVVAYARAVGCADPRASGPRPLTEGSSLPGFRVVTAVPRSELALAGRHRFSSYALIFHIDELSAGRSRLRAESRAAFPRLSGTLYRMLVIGSGGHVIGVRRLLSGIKRAAEARTRS
jgi:hypothetical protein